MVAQKGDWKKTKKQLKQEKPRKFLESKEDWEQRIEDDKSFSAMESLFFVVFKTMFFKVTPIAIVIHVLWG